jgi:hypothetical protein
VYDPAQFEPSPTDPQEGIRRLKQENSMLRQELLHLEEDYRGLQTKRLQDVSITSLLLQPALLTGGCNVVQYSFEFFYNIHTTLQKTVTHPPVCSLTSTKYVYVVVMFQTCIQGIACSDLGQISAASDQNFSWFSSVSPGV